MHTEQSEIVESTMTNIAFERVVIVGDMFVQMLRKFAAFEEFDAAYVAYIQTDIVVLLHVRRDTASIGFEFILHVADQARVHSILSANHL